MNVRRFTGRTSREAMQKVKEAFGNDAIVLSNKAAPEGGVEIMAMAPEGMAAIEKQAAHQSRQEPVDEGSKAPKGGARQAVASLATTVQEDVRQLAMSTLSFQDYVRERMLRRRQAALKARMEPELAPTPEDQLAQRVGSNGQGAAKAPALAARTRAVVDEPLDLAQPLPSAAAQAAPRVALAVAELPQAAAQLEPQAQPLPQSAPQRPGLWSDPADLTMSQMVAQTPKPTPGNARPSATAVAAAQVAAPDDGTREALAAAQAANASMLGELRAMRAMMKERFETIAFIERLQRTPSQATMAQRLLDGGFSPVLIRKMIDGMPADVVAGQRDPMDWAGMVLERNLNTADNEPNIEDQGGIFALIGATGVGKTTSTAKLAALFAAKHGAHNLGLITLDAYRMGAHEQLRAYGRILNVPVHIAHDRAALEDLLELLAGKKMILIDTAGMPQRDARTREMLEMVSHKSIRKLLVVNASAQGDAIEDVLVAYQAHKCAGVVLSKLDEAVKLGPALDALIRHKTKILGVANGQRVPEDWHRLTATSLVHRALRASLNPAFRLDPNEVSLILAANALSDTAAANPSSAA
ncbi:flagellar biosynthesis protein FlhF [Aquabacterium lacunae]|uniref:Flagellar biosynthesis protein FlhF n=1 Tax=Aquabacterium lacunae TaxID=2528630 RepID=A0A4Q9H515_9BURK|nr:flagellar biosynthesis protein FlhF [Aquabacterium lacunae]TBO34195.1 flagellar biosynthesis protein FlhF [Aquabacterium lacunae]